MTASAIDTTLVRPFTEIGREDLPIAGGKGANLGEMTRAGLPIPSGFVITIEAYRRAWELAGLESATRPIVANINVNDAVSLETSAAALQASVARMEIPAEERDAIVAAYHSLSGDAAPVAVAVRSSATAEDTADSSFAGMFESFLNVRGDEALLEAVRKCWASTFGARVLFYRLTRKMPALMPVAVVVQRMVNSGKSGVMFTADPSTSDRSRIVIEAAWGLGEVIVGGQVTPDRYVLDKETLHPLLRVVGRKDFLLTRDATTGATTRIDLVNDARATAQVLTDAELTAVADLGKRVEKHYGVPQDIEFALEGDRVYLTQSRPITTLAPLQSTAAGVTSDAKTPAAVLLRGLGASPGTVSGQVRVLQNTAEAGKLRAGEILVARMTSPDWVPIMRRAAAIITDSGGMTSHAAIISRELGIPCIVGAGDGMRVLRDGVVVTVNGVDGTVTAGAAKVEQEPASAKAQDTVSGGRTVATTVTGTRLYVNLAEPDRAEAVARADVDGVGLLRAEFMLLDALERRHPRQLLAEGRGDEFVRRMADKLKIFARAFHPRPVIYRAMDFRSNEVRGLAGGEAVEPREENPMIGYRGCFRYTKEPDLFALELQALHEARKEHRNLHLMIPFVRTGWEMRACKALIDKSPLGSATDLQLWVMAEVPSVISWLEEYASLGVSGISIGSNDLTQLILGVDRDSNIVAPLYNERDRAVLDAIRAIIHESHRLGLTCSICGQAPSVYPDYAERLIEWGIDSISVNPDVVDVTRRNIAAAEQRIVLARARTSN